MLSRRGGGGPAIKIPDRRAGTGPALKTGDRRAGTGPAFKIGERVLCYEPDPRRTKMLYDAKVLDIRKVKLSEISDKFTFVPDRWAVIRESST